MKTVAVIQSYRAETNATGQYKIELTRFYPTDEFARKKVDFDTLEDFSLVVCKPDRKIIYSGCQWSSISEDGTLGNMTVGRMHIVAKHRDEQILLKT